MCTLSKTVSGWIFLKIVELLYLSLVNICNKHVFRRAVDMGIGSICFYELDHRNRKSWSRTKLKAMTGEGFLLKA